MPDGCSIKTSAQIPTVSAEELAELGKQGHVDLIDVRTPGEFRVHHGYMCNGKRSGKNALEPGP